MTAECPPMLREVLEDPWEAHVHLMAAEAIVHAFAAFHELSPEALAELHDAAFIGSQKALCDPANLSRSEVFTVATQAVVDRLQGWPALAVVSEDG